MVTKDLKLLDPGACLQILLSSLLGWVFLGHTLQLTQKNQTNSKHFMSCLSICPKGFLALVWLGSGSTTPWGSGLNAGAPRRLGLERCSEGCVSRRGCAEAWKVPFVTGTVVYFLLFPTSLCLGMYDTTFLNQFPYGKQTKNTKN